MSDGLARGYAYTCRCGTSIQLVGFIVERSLWCPGCREPAPDYDQESQPTMSRQDHDDLHGRPSAKPAVTALGRPTLQRNPPAKPRTAIGQSLHVHGEAVDHVEALYLQAHGEITDEVEQAEAAREATGKEALEHVARYLRWVDDQRLAIDRERERLDGIVTGLDRRQQWGEAKAADLAEALAPGKRKVQAGTFTIKINPTTAIEAPKDLDPRTLPAAWQRAVAEVPAIPATVALDKKAAKADLLQGWHEGPPPHAGWYTVEHHGRVWLGPVGDSWMIGAHDGRGMPLPSAGLSIEPTPGLDVLRWKHAPLGVALVHRVHVTVK